MQVYQVPKLLLIQCQVLLRKGYGVEPRACTIVSKVYKDVDVEPHLLPIDSEVFNLKIHRHKPWGYTGH